MSERGADRHERGADRQAPAHRIPDKNCHKAGDRFHKVGDGRNRRPDRRRQPRGVSSDRPLPLPRGNKDSEVAKNICLKVCRKVQNVVNLPSEYTLKDEKPHNQYYGELSYTMQYRHTMGRPFNWLYIDFDTLSTVARQQGFKAELIAKGPHFDYLARIVRP